MSPPPEPSKPVETVSDGAPWGRFVGAGLELAGFTLCFAGLGFGIDKWLGNKRLVGTALVTLVGFSLAMARFVVLASAASEKPAKRRGE